MLLVYGADPTAALDDGRLPGATFDESVSADARQSIKDLLAKYAKVRPAPVAVEEPKDTKRKKKGCAVS